MTFKPSNVRLSLIVFISCHGVLLGQGYCSTPGIPTLASCAAGSCVTRCGEARKICSCDKACYFYNDCCEDFHSVCHRRSEFALNIVSLYAEKLRKHFVQEISFLRERPSSDCRFIPGLDRWIRVVDGCLNGSRCSVTHEDIQSEILTSDVQTKVHFVNVECAFCNGVAAEDILIWPTDLVCTKANISQWYNGRGRPVSSLQQLFTDRPEYFKSALRHRSCRLKRYLPRKIKTSLHECNAKGVIDTCPSNCQNSRLVDLCENGPQLISGYKDPLTGQEADVRNLHCALCNELNAHCGKSNLYATLEGRLGGGPTTFSLNLLFSLNKKNRLQVGYQRARIPECPISYRWVPALNTCTRVTCEQAEAKFVRDECVLPEITVVFLDYKINESPVKTNDLNNKLTSLKSSLENSTNVYFTDERFISVQVDVPSADELTNKQIKNVVKVKITVKKYGPSINLRSNSNFAEDLKAYLENATVRNHTNYNATVTSLIITNLTQSGPNENKNCTRIILELHKHFKIVHNTTIQVLINRQKLSAENYSWTRNRSAVIVCAEHLIVTYSTDPMGIVTGVLMSISVLFLFLRLLLQCFIKELQTHGGRLQFHMVLSLMMAFIAFLIAPNVSGVYWICYTVAIAQHVCFLAFFVWTSAIALNLATSLRRTRTLSRRSRPRKLAYPFLFSWGISIMVATVAVVINHSGRGIPRIFKPRYARGLCFFNQTIALWIFFCIPILISILINILLFIYSVVTIRAIRASSTANVTKSESEDLGVYLRMFATMGFTWLMGFIANSVNNPVTWYMFIVLNAGSGIYLFVAFVSVEGVRNRFIRKLTVKKTGLSTIKLKSETSTEQTST